MCFDTLWTDAAKLLKALTHSISSFLVYVWPQMINELLNPAIFVTSRSACFTFSWSPGIVNVQLCKQNIYVTWIIPWNNWRNEACVPVVPFTPRKRRLSRTVRRAFSSIRRSWIHKQALFPTVVSCAALSDIRLFLKWNSKIKTYITVGVWILKWVILWTHWQTEKVC